MSVELFHSTSTYSVEFEDKEYSVTVETNFNFDYTDITVLHEGYYIEGDLKDSIINYFHENK